MSPELDLFIVKRFSLRCCRALSDVRCTIIKCILLCLLYFVTISQSVIWLCFLTSSWQCNSLFLLPGGAGGKRQEARDKCSSNWGDAFLHQLKGMITIGLGFSVVSTFCENVIHYYFFICTSLCLWSQRGVSSLNLMLHECRRPKLWHYGRAQH